MFNEPSLSVSLPPSLYCLSSSLSRPSSTFFSSLHPCLSVSPSFLQANWHRILVQDEFWMLTRTKTTKTRRTRRRRAHLHPISLRSSTSLWPGSILAKYIICFLSLNFFSLFDILQFINPGSTFHVTRQFGGGGGSTISRITSGNLVCVFPVWKACGGAVPAPKCS